MIKEKVMFGFNVEKELLESLKKLKELNEKSLTVMLNRALRDYLEKEYTKIFSHGEKKD